MVFSYSLLFSSLLLALKQSKEDGQETGYESQLAQLWSGGRGAGVRRH